MQLSLFDGKRCSKCGIWHPFDFYHKHPQKKDGLQPSCKACRSNLNARWWENNRDRPEIIKRRKDYRDLPEVKAVNLQYQRDFRKKDGGQRDKAKNQRWKDRHPERYRELLRLRYLRHLDRIKARKKIYVRENPDKYKVWNHNRRARKNGNGGTFTHDEWIALCEKYGKCCLRCGKKRRLTVDHVIPLSEGGRNSIENLQPLCKPCNSSKGARTIDYRPNWQVSV